MSANVGLTSNSIGKVQLALSYDYNQLSVLKTGSKKLDRDRERVTQSIIFQSDYKINRLFSLETLFSWVRQERTTYGAFGKDFTHTQGIGDAVILLKAQITPSDSKYNVRIGAGPKIPLGSSSKTNSKGGVESADLQPGSGSWDGILWGNLSTTFDFRPSLATSITSIYRYTGENRNYLGTSTYEFGNELQLIGGISDQLLAKNIVLEPSFALRYRNVRVDRFNDAHFPNTGGNFLYLIPAISINLTTRLSLGFTYEIPIYAKPIGTQVVPAYRVNVGILYSFALKQDPEIEF